MLVAIITVHRPHGFFINWYGNQKGEGIEYHLLALGIAVTLIIAGAGAWSPEELWRARANVIGQAAGKCYS